MISVWRARVWISGSSSSSLYKRVTAGIPEWAIGDRWFQQPVGLFAPGVDRRSARLLESILHSLAVFDTCLAQHRVFAMRDNALFARQHVTTVRAQYQLALAKLYTKPIASEVLQRRELLHRLDVVGLRLADTTDVLSDATIKRG